jgi:hypothetical protein
MTDGQAVDDGYSQFMERAGVLIAEGSANVQKGTRVLVSLRELEQAWKRRAADAAARSGRADDDGALARGLAAEAGFWKDAGRELRATVAAALDARDA